VCPVKIDIPELLLYLRAEITEDRKQEQEADGRRQEAGGKVSKRRMERLAFKIWAAVMARPRLHEWSARLSRVLQSFIVRDGKIGKVGSLLSRLAPPLGAWTRARDMRPLATPTFREQWRHELADKSHEVKS
jgi:L-lactate dehydrogenase complex protein LldF